MAKGASIKFKSYEESVPKLLGLLKLGKELKKYDKIILKPTLKSEGSVSVDFAESVLKFCIENKNPVAEIFIAEGADGDTMELFDEKGYRKLAEEYSVGLIDLNDSEVEEIEDSEFLRLEKIYYPKILLDSFVISLAKSGEDEETDILGTLSGMLGAYPLGHYKGFFSKTKNKIRKWPIKYAIHDIVRCKMPEFGIIDASKKGVILAGLPLEIDKQAAKLLGKNWKEVPYLKLLDKSFLEIEEKTQIKEESKIY